MTQTIEPPVVEEAVVEEAAAPAPAPEPPKRRAQRVCEWAVGADYKDFPAETVEFTKALLLKTIAGMIAGSREPAARILTTYFAEQGGSPEVGLVGAGYRSTVENAAYANATFAHSSELEDNEMPNFTSAYWMLPALFPVAEKQTASGKDLITAAIVTWEVASRYSSAGPGEALMSTHICPPSWFGPLGVAVGTAKLLKLDAGRTEHALSMAGSWSSGLGQAGCDTHFLESGHTAKMGVQSAFLARLGATAELGVLDIKNGIYAPLVANGEIDLTKIDADLGQAPYRINRACIKKYSATSSNSWTFSPTPGSESGTADAAQGQGRGHHRRRVGCRAGHHPAFPRRGGQGGVRGCPPGLAGGNGRTGRGWPKWFGC
ncbi:2-methylcitrate dehydratase PrpD [Gordonia amarae]|nr:2-methylcitrate dehydratase PrpD [Gordonia amarae]